VERLLPYTNPSQPPLIRGGEFPNNGNLPFYFTLPDKGGIGWVCKPQKGKKPNNPDYLKKGND
jgi:hypothetical protein